MAADGGGFERMKRRAALAEALTALAEAGRSFPEDLIEEAETLLRKEQIMVLHERQRVARERLLVSVVLEHGLRRHKDAISPEAAMLGLVAAKLYHLDDELERLFPWAVPNG